MQESLDTIQYVFRVMAASQVLMLSGYMIIYQRTTLGWLTALVTHGIFRSVRNPIYTGILTSTFGLVLLVPNLLSLGGALFWALGVEFAVRGVEEPVHVFRDQCR